MNCTLKKLLVDCAYHRKLILSFQGSCTWRRCVDGAPQRASPTSTNQGGHLDDPSGALRRRLPAEEETDGRRRARQRQGEDAAPAAKDKGPRASVASGL